MFTIIGGNPFISFTGNQMFTGLRIVDKVETFQEMEKVVKENFEDCGGLILILDGDEEIQYNENGNYLDPSL